MSKRVMWIIIAAIIVVLGGGSVFAYFAIAKSDKAEYFQAEKSTFEYIKDQTSEQFEPELNWSEKVREQPVDTSAEFSAQYHAQNNPAGGTGQEIDIEDIINNASLTFNSQSDLESHQMRVGLEADVASFELDDFNMYIDDDRLVMDLPFLDDSLQIHNENINDLLKDIDPNAEDVEIDFSSFFESAQGIPDEDIEHLKEEYIISIYDNLPKDAFDSEKETVDVDGEEVKAKNITMNLSEDEVKEVIVSILEKAQDDEELQKIVKQQLQAETAGAFAKESDVDIATDVDTLFNEDIDEAIETVENDLQMPDGITSEVWVDDDLIVKRNLRVSGENEDGSSEFIVKGTNALEDEQQTYDYELTVVDPNDEEYTANITADMAMKDDEIEDTVEISVADITLTYEGQSTLEDGKRDFERTLNLASQTQGIDGSFVWSGNFDYEEDQVATENEFTVETDMLGDIEASLFVDMTGEIIKEVEQPDEESVKDLGDMSENELQQYVQQDAMPKAQEWLMNQLGGFGGFAQQGDGNGGPVEPQTGDEEDFADADEETTTFELEDVGGEVTTEVKHKADMVTHFEQITTINYEEAGVNKEEIKGNMEEQNQELNDLDAVNIDYDYGDAEVKETMTVNVTDGEVQIMKQILGDTGNSDYVSFEAVTAFLEGQGFAEK